MPTPDWILDADQRLTDVFQEERLGPRSTEGDVAIEHLRWSLWCLESLYELQELIALDPPRGDGGPTALGHRSYPIAMGHLMWAAVSAMGAIDRMAAAFGALTLGLKANGWVYDFTTLKGRSGRISRKEVLGWLSTVANDPVYADLIAVIRNPIVHSTTLIQVTRSITLGGRDQAPPTGGFAFKGDNGQAITATRLLNASIPFVERLFLESVTVVECWKATPHDSPS